MQAVALITVQQRVNLRDKRNFFKVHNAEFPLVLYLNVESKRKVGQYFRASEDLVFICLFRHDAALCVGREGTTVPPGALRCGKAHIAGGRALNGLAPEIRCSSEHQRSCRQPSLDLTSPCLKSQHLSRGWLGGNPRTNSRRGHAYFWRVREFGCVWRVWRPDACRRAQSAHVDHSRETEAVV